MSEGEFKPELNKAPGDEGTPPPSVNPIVTLAIEWDTTTGEMNIKGPVGNKPVCYGMLKMAEKLIDGYVSPAAQKGIIQRIMGGGNNGHPAKGFRGFPGR